MKKGLAVVAVVTNLVGRIAEPQLDPDGPGGGTPWPKGFTKNLSGEYLAEIVAVYVADLDEGGALKLMLRSVVTGALAEVYADHVRVRSGGAQ